MRWIIFVLDFCGGKRIVQGQTQGGIQGICPAFFPQYLTRAMLEGQLHPTMPSEAGIEWWYGMSF